MEKCERNTLFARPRRRLENNIRMGVKKTGWRVWAQFFWLSPGTQGRLL